MLGMSSHLYTEDASSKVSPKVTAAGVASAVTMIVLYLLGQIPFIASWPNSIETALFGLITAAITWGAGYLVPDAARFVESHVPEQVATLLNLDDIDVDALLQELADKITGKQATAGTATVGTATVKVNADTSAAHASLEKLSKHVDAVAQKIAKTGDVGLVESDMGSCPTVGD